jgi:hypothetical protein
LDLLDLPNKLVISVDPGLHLVLKVLSALDVVNQVVHVVGGGDGSLYY